jgi:S1-C subfamily serine protease
MGNRPRLGIRPGYNEGETGVLVEGVSPGEAAEKAGIKLGDRIVEMGGKPVQNIEGYMQLMGTLKPGTTIDLTVLRKDQKLSLKVQIPMPVASP